MKKVAILLAMAVVLMSSLAVYAGATKYDLVQGVGAVGEHADASGFAIVNETPKGDVTTVVQIQVRNAAPNFTYWVRSNGEDRGSFTTNKKGNGHFHLNLAATDLELGVELTVRSGPNKGAKVLYAVL